MRTQGLAKRKGTAYVTLSRGFLPGVRVEPNVAREKLLPSGVRERNKACGMVGMVCQALKSETTSKLSVSENPSGISNSANVLCESALLEPRSDKTIRASRKPGSLGRPFIGAVGISSRVIRT